MLTLKPRNEYDRSNYNLGHGQRCGIFKSIICTPTLLFWYIELERQHISICVDHVYPIEGEIKDTTDTCRCALLSKLTVCVGYEWGKKMISILPLWTFHLYITTFQYHLYIKYIVLRYSRAYGYYNGFLDRGLLLTRKLLKQGFPVVKFD